MSPIGEIELGGMAHRGGADGAVATADSGGSNGAPVALQQRMWTGGKGGAHGMVAREDKRGEEKGWRRQAAPFNGAAKGGGAGPTVDGPHWPMADGHRQETHAWCGAEQGRQVTDPWAQGHSIWRCSLNRFENFKWFENVQISLNFD
jgi:hypothetical protein